LIRYVLVAGAVLVSLVGFTACGGGVSEHAVVRVGGIAITKGTVDHWMSVMAGGRVVADSSQQRYLSLRRQALDFLISSEWLLGEAASEGLKMSDQKIEQRFNEKRNASFPGGEGEFHEFLKTTGQTVSDIMFEAKAELASSGIRQAVASKEAKVTQAQIAEYYSQHKQHFAVQEERELEITNTKSETQANKLKREVESGRSFADMSGRVTLERPRAGEVGEKYALVRAVFSTKLNVLVGPIKRRVDYYLFEVKRIIPGREQTLAEVQDSIEKQLATEKQRRTLGKLTKALKAKWTARTDCHPGYVVQKCKQYKAPSTTSPEDLFTLK